ncbi:5'-AMP-activated protein kinase subunit gamma-2-like isoform X3 [Hippocampus comes]|uniref:5'-AMP-activated protein kinase subunit gamma-2-like isoform X3 n=1 Tax=Hippocampus comes TaxID=109280 RepID=UPI00094EF7D6|nr:PREDICTED: 5'-AMP-activated protein kinase subunit gamma-2-like isoform X3 [Hippocampus comes]
MASTNAPAGAENDKASKGESSGGRNLVLRAGSTASGAMPNSGKSIAESPPPTRRLSFSGMFRSASRESNQQMSPIANKLFSRNKRSKSRAFSLSCAPPQPPPPPPAPLQGPRGPGQVGAFRLETYASEPRRLRSFSSPPDAARASSPSASAFAGPTPLAPPLAVGGRDSVASVRAADFGSTPE